MFVGKQMRVYACFLQFFFHGYFCVGTVVMSPQHKGSILRPDEAIMPGELFFDFFVTPLCNVFSVDGAMVCLCLRSMWK